MSNKGLKFWTSVICSLIECRNRSRSSLQNWVSSPGSGLVRGNGLAIGVAKNLPCVFP